ncbi:MULTISPECIES: non-ribosomal peptide synthetase [unclassified Mycobacterium]|uniref:non-ribosomal peptide synthetase n=1 Tax=unclassified Mycobacterium TaxID=2642494 RepID=UPI0007402FAA|nr:MULTISPECIES: non-ribosomal peptide synthetase [unclassified Mycobacterium]KUH80472.1 non-ribosomal peptide synthetase [Mycobacterium sp. GA-1999]KUH89163.1 non-ribosomal peptide synthetase [Mycobacterium sp. GA-0227b]
MGVGETGSASTENAASPGPADRTVREEVAELLGVNPDEVDPDADLIASGLDSIRMMSLSGRWRKQGIDVNFAALAENPTVAAWSALVSDRSSNGGPDRVAETAPAGDENEPFPLAPMQHAMWLGRNDDQQLGGVAAHLYVEFDGVGVDPERLRRAATKLVARHPMLRVEILPDGTQRIGERGLPVTVHDLRDLDREAAEQRLEAIRHEKSHQILDGDVLELSLSLRPDGRTRLHVDMDMNAADAVSYRKFMADLAAFYRGGELPDLGYTYREYRAALTAADRGPSAEDLQWWAERIPELPESPALPLIPLAEQQDPRRSVRLWHIFDVATRDALFAAAHRRGITPAMAVAASYANALARWSSGPRFLLNLPMFGREPFHPDVEKLVGCFTSSLMLDIDLANTRTPTQRARAVQETLHYTARHSSYSGLSVLRDLGRHRGNQVLAPIVYTSALGLGDLFAGEVTDQFGAPVWTISQGPQVLIDAQATPLADGLMINWDVRVDAFRPGVADAMFAYHLAELTRLATDDAAWDAPDPPAVPEPQRAVRQAVNSATAPLSNEAIHDGFFRNARVVPDAPAMFSRDGDLTYGELRDRALGVAAALRDNGVHPGDLVALVGPKCAEQIPAVLGILATGAAYLPIGADQPAERTARILDASAVSAVLLCGGADMVHADVPVLTVSEATARDTAVQPAEVDPNALAYVLFTSGSTGEPKGVELTHDAVMNTIEFVTDHFGIDTGDRSLALASLEADMSVLEIFAILRAGGAVVVVDEDQRRNPDAWARLIQQHGVTFLNWMPGWLDMLLEAGADRLAGLRVVLLGGDWVRPELVRALRKSAPKVRAAGLGGATETAVHGTICEVDDPPAHWTSVPYGTPLPNNACRVVAADGSDCPDWVPGELWFTGRGIARGYRGRPDLTAEKFVEHEGRTWYRTGDLVRYLPDGTLEFVGRVDHRVKISGYRIELGEVEAALKRVGGVDAAVAAVIPGDRDVLAAVVRTDDPAVDARAVTAAMGDLVPAHMIPKVIVVADRIPFTVNGKIDRQAVARLLADAEPPAAQAYRAPATPLESALVAIVAEVLDIEAAKVGVDDDFFSLGGDSVLATQVIARVRDWLDTPTVLVTDMFAARCVAKLAERLLAREADSERLDAVAEVYLEVAEMDSAAVLSELESSA